VRDEQGGLLKLPLDTLKLALKLGPGHRIEGTERFVHEQYWRLDGERPGDADPLPLATGQLARPPVRERRRQADEIEQFRRPRATPFNRPPLQPRDERQVVLDGQVRKEPDLLQDIASPPPERDRIPFPGIATFDHDRTGLWHEHPVRQLQQRAFPGSTPADERNDFAACKRQVDAIDAGARTSIGDRAIVPPWVCVADAGELHHGRHTIRRAQWRARQSLR
jgi:hypothetical protein